MKKNIYIRFVLMAILAVSLQCDLSAQAQLSFQGILKKANGLAVDDGFYRLTFTLYNAETLGTSQFTETIDSVEITGGIYSVILGAGSTPLNASFNVPYWLGIKVGGPSAAEMTPRIRLTSAPYALALRGSSNSFPSSGVVIADSMRAKGKIVARAGEPGANGANNNGFGFSSPGDRDGGLYSEIDGQVAIWANNSERILVSNVPGDNRTYLRGNVTVDNSLQVGDQLNVTGDVSSDLKFSSGKKLQYNGLSDWRLVDIDIFSPGNAEGWGATTGLLNSTDATAPVIENFSNHFHGYALRPSNESDVLKKEFTLDRNAIGNFSRVKIRFKYFFLDSWDPSGSEGTDLGIAGVGTTKSLTTMGICWTDATSVYDNGVEELDFYDSSSNYADAATVGEMVFSTRDNVTSNFWIFFAAKMVGTDDENYAIGDIEVWVQ